MLTNQFHTKKSVGAYVYLPQEWRLGRFKDCQFQYIIIFLRWQFLEPHSTTPKGDRHLRSLTFLYQTDSLITFIWSMFWYTAYFWQRQVIKGTYYAIFVRFNILKMATFGHPPGPLLWEIDICAHWLFCTKLTP